MRRDPGRPRRRLLDPGPRATRSAPSRSRPSCSSSSAEPAPDMRSAARRGWAPSLARRPEPAAVRRLCRPRVDRAARDRHRRLERLRHDQRRAAPSGPDDSVAGYDLRYRGVEESRGANAQEIRAVVDVSRDGESLGTLRPGKNRYFAEQQVSNEAAIRSDPLNGEDLSSSPTDRPSTARSSSERS